MARSRERPEQIEFLHCREQEAGHSEELAKQQVADTELKANKILDEQRRANEQVTSSDNAKNKLNVLFKI